MADQQDGEPDKRRVSQEIDRSVSAFAAKNLIDEAQVLGLIARFGNDHSVLTEQARHLRHLEAMKGA